MKPRHLVIAILACLLFVAALASAQPPPAGSQAPSPLVLGQAGAGATPILFEQNDGPLALVQTFTYRYVIDGVLPSTIIAVTCTALGAVNTCQFPLPPLTAGLPHAITLTAAASPTSIESPPSVLYTFTLEVVPKAPSNVRAGKSGGPQG